MKKTVGGLLLIGNLSKSIPPECSNYVFARAQTQNRSPVFLLRTNDFTLTGSEADRSTMLVLLHDARFLQRHPVDMQIGYKPFDYDNMIVQIY